MVQADPIDPSFFEAKIACTYVSRGAPGAAGNELRISAGNGFFAYVGLSDRSGKLQLRGVRECKGRAEPRLDNIDSISINFKRPKFGFVTIDASRSALGPGATREDDGSSEIEVTTGELRGSADISLGGGDDEVTGEVTGEKSVGITLTAGLDTDLDVRGAAASLSLALGDGDDTYSEPPAPRRGLFGPPSIVGFVSGDAGRDLLEGTQNLDFFDGGTGADTITGGPGFDYLIDGDDDDSVAGNGGRDWLEAYGGRDDVEGGGGDDIIFANDSRRDRIDCGEDEDTALVDRRRDVYEGCEHVRKGGHVIFRRHEKAVERAREFFARSG